MNKIKENCVFCKILKGDIPSYKVYEDEFLIGILDNQPANSGHVIIIPKHHAENIFELSEEEARRVLPVAKAVAVAVKKAFNCDGVNLLQNNGEAAGQTVNHFHMHVIPRFHNDTVSVEWKPKQVNDFERAKDEIVRNLGGIV